MSISDDSLNKDGLSSENLSSDLNLPSSPKEYADWSSRNGITSSVSKFESLMDSYLEATSNYKQLHEDTSTVPLGKVVFSLKSQKDVAARELLTFLLSGSHITHE